MLASMPGRGEILLVDDDPIAMRLLRAILGPLRIEMHGVGTGAEALARIRDRPVRVMVLDLVLPDTSGLDVLEAAIAARPELPVIMLTGADDAATAVRALRKGAYDYLTKPVDHEQLLASVQRALERERLLGEVQALQDEVRSTILASEMGPSAEIAGLVQRVNQVAASSMSVLLLGETGAGKELVARAIHRASGRKDHPFVTIDCGAIPEALLESELFGHEEGAFTGARRKQKGQFELADGGTLFLDEIGNLSVTNQAKLLRVLEERKLRPLGSPHSIAVDVRIIAATNEQLEERARRGEFRQDLYFRLAEYTIHLPSLRARRGDIAHLAHRFCAQAAVELGKPVTAIDREAMARLEAHDWPGNVRELRNTVRRAVLVSSGDTLRAEHLLSLVPAPQQPRRETGSGPGALAGRSLREVVEEASSVAERWALEEALATSGGKQAEAARLLQVDAKTLYRKLQRHGIKRER